MSSKTTFWFAAVAALVLFGSSAFAVPLQVINAPLSADGEKEVVTTSAPSEVVLVPETVEEEVNSSNTPVKTPTAPVETQPSSQQQQQDTKTEEIVGTGSGSKIESENSAANPEVEVIEVLSPVMPVNFGPSQSPASSDPEQSNPTAPSNSAANKPTSPVPNQNRPKPYYPSDVQAVVKFGADFPFTFAQLLQPFHQAFQPFPQPFQPPFQQSGYNQPPRYQPQPYGASVDPFDPFANPMMRLPLSQLVEMYTSDFRNLFQNFDKGMSQMNNNMDTAQTIPDKPMSKTTSKTEVIDGHLVQINETTYSNGDGNHKSFYHFKEIKVLPDDKTKTITNENAVSVTKDERDETNEIVRDPSSETVVASSGAVVSNADDKQNLIKKTHEPVPLDDHFQTAAATYYAPYAPYGVPYRPPSSAGLYYGRPPGPGNYPSTGGRPHRPMAPVSLHGDTLVNQLVAAQQQASGSNAVLPPDVEIIDVNGNPQRPLSGQYYYDNGGGQRDKFFGRKN